MIGEIQIEGTFPGRHQAGHDPHPIRSRLESHDSRRIFSRRRADRAERGRPTARIEVGNRGDRPVQVGSHCHFFEVNRYLEFDRAAAYGMRLNIAAGTAVRFEPGDTREVELVALGGTREVFGLNRLVEGRARRCDGARRGAANASTKFDHAEHENRSPHLRRSLRPDDRRSHPPGRHRPRHSDRARRDRLRRRSEVRRRQGDSRRHGAVADRDPRRAARPISSSPTSSSSTAPAFERPTSASATAASPRSARPAIRASWTASRRGS